MFTLRTFLNRIRTSSAAGRAELKARASRALEDIRRAHQRITAEAKMLDRHVESELRYKAALTRIDARLVCLTDALAAAEATGDAAIGKLARATAQWTLRKRACEAELNLVRKRINTARHGWAKIEKDAKQLGQWLRDALAGARPAWAEAVRRMSEKLTRRDGGRAQARGGDDDEKRPALRPDGTFPHRWRSCGARWRAARCGFCRAHMRVRLFRREPDTLSPNRLNCDQKEESLECPAAPTPRPRSNVLPWNFSFPRGSWKRGQSRSPRQ